MLGRLINQSHAIAKQAKRPKTIKYSDLSTPRLLVYGARNRRPSTDNHNLCVRNPVTGQVVHSKAESDWFYLSRKLPFGLPSAVIARRSILTIHQRYGINRGHPRHRSLERGPRSKGTGASRGTSGRARFDHPFDAHTAQGHRSRRSPRTLRQTSRSTTQIPTPSR